MQHRQALKRLAALFHRDDPATELDPFSGPTLLEQEPDLANEAARHSLNSSAWAAGGQPSD